MLNDDGRRDSRLTMDLIDEARAMRDATVGRYLSMGWSSLRNLAARLFHTGPAPEARLR